MAKKYIYSDLNLINPKTDPLITNIDSVYQSLYVLFNTVPGERVFNPAFGSDLDDMLFELINEDSELQIFRIVVEAIERYEPRVKINYGDTTIVADAANNLYNVELVFDIRGETETDFKFQGEITRG